MLDELHYCSLPCFQQLGYRVTSCPLRRGVFGVKKRFSPSNADTFWGVIRPNKEVRLSAILLVWPPIVPPKYPLKWFTHDMSEKVCTDHIDFDTLHNRPENLVPSCSPCNLARTKTTVAQFS